MASRYMAHNDTRRKALNATLTVRSREKEQGEARKLSKYAKDEDK